MSKMKLTAKETLSFILVCIEVVVIRVLSEQEEHLLEGGLRNRERLDVKAILDAVEYEEQVGDCLSILVVQTVLAIVDLYEERFLLTIADQRVRHVLDYKILQECHVV